MKTKKKIAKELYIKVALFMALLALSVYLLMFSILDISYFIIYDNLEFLKTGAVFLSSFTLTMIVTMKLRPAWLEFERLRGVPKKTFYEFLRESFPSFLMAIFLLLFAFGFEWYFSAYLSINVTTTVAKDMLEEILTINGLLLGFSGVVLAQVLSTVYNKGNWIYQQLITNRNDFLLVDELQKEIKILRKTRLRHIILVFYSMLPLFGSILLAFGEISKIDVNQTVLLATKDVFFSPLIATLIGVVLLVISLLQFNLLPEIQQTKQLKLNSEK